MVFRARRARLATGQPYNILVNTSALTTVNGTFANTTGGTLARDGRGGLFAINDAADADNGPLPNDVTLTVVSVAPEPYLPGRVGLVTGVQVEAHGQDRVQHGPGRSREVHPVLAAG